MLYGIAIICGIKMIHLACDYMNLNFEIALYNDINYIHLCFF